MYVCMYKYMFTKQAGLAATSGSRLRRWPIASRGGEEKHFQKYARARLCSDSNRFLHPPALGLGGFKSFGSNAPT